MFDSARQKFMRAQHHVADLKGEFEAFVKRKPHRFGIKHDEETGQPVIQIRFVERVPDSFSVVIGDAIHNLRCALDHLTWELIGWDGGAQNRHTQFPCRETKADFEGTCGAFDTPSVWIKDMLKDFAGYVGGAGETLYVIHMLDVADKHRAIAPVLRATTHPPFQVFDKDGTAIIRMTGNRFIGGMGDVLPIVGVPAGGHVELEDDAKCTPSIFMKEPGVAAGDVFVTLGRFLDSTRGVITKIEGEVAKHPKA